MSPFLCLKNQYSSAELGGTKVCKNNPNPFFLPSPFAPLLPPFCAAPHVSNTLAIQIGEGGRALSWCQISFGEVRCPLSVQSTLNWMLEGTTSWSTCCSIEAVLRTDAPEDWRAASLCRAAGNLTRGALAHLTGESQGITALCWKNRLQSDYYKGIFHVHWYHGFRVDLAQFLHFTPWAVFPSKFYTTLRGIQLHSKYDFFGTTGAHRHSSGAGSDECKCLCFYWEHHPLYAIAHITLLVLPIMNSTRALLLQENLEWGDNACGTTLQAMIID